MGSIRMLANAIDEKDPYTRGHSERVAFYSMLMAQAHGHVGGGGGEASTSPGSSTTWARSASRTRSCASRPPSPTKSTRS